MSEALLLLLLGCLHVLTLRVQALPLVLQLCFELMLLLPQHVHGLQPKRAIWTVLTHCTTAPQDVHMMRSVGKALIRELHAKLSGTSFVQSSGTWRLLHLNMQFLHSLAVQHATPSCTRDVMAARRLGA